MDQWRETEKTFDYDKLLLSYEEKLKKWQEKAQAARKEGKAQPGDAPVLPEPNDRPASTRKPLQWGAQSDYRLRNKRRDLVPRGKQRKARTRVPGGFPLMIQSWRDAWKQGDFSFYWVQLADFMNEVPEPPTEQTWPELREAQTLTLDKLKSVGEAVIISVGEGRDIHPRNKQMVANRLVRNALARDYGIDLPHQSPATSPWKPREIKSFSASGT